MINGLIKPIWLSGIIVFCLCTGFVLEGKTFIESESTEALSRSEKVPAMVLTASNDSHEISEGTASYTFDLFALTSEDDPVLAEYWSCETATFVIGTMPTFGGTIDYDPLTCTLTFYPNENYSNPSGVAVDYTVTTSLNESTAEGTVTLFIAPVNDAPVAGDYSVSLCEDASSPVDISPGDNVSDIDSDVVSIDISTDASNGSVVVDGLSLTYEPDPDFYGTDTVVYTVTDQEGEESNEATITITVLGQNDVPTANDNQSINIDIFDDSDPVSFDLADSPVNASDIESDDMILSILSAPIPNVNISTSGSMMTVEAGVGSCGDISIELEVCNVAENLNAHDASCLPLSLCSGSITINLEIQATDGDEDGLPLYIEGAVADADPDSDMDSDGIPDSVEAIPYLDESNPCDIVFANTDGEGNADYNDTDSDGDGILDIDEGFDDADGDEIPNFRDLDSDGDGILDEVEGDDDFDTDSFPNYLDLDSDDDGIEDGDEDQDFEGDWDCAGGETNWLDNDSDGDGILDGVEIHASAIVPTALLGGTSVSYPSSFDGDATLPLDIDSDDDGLTDGPGIGGVWASICEDCDANGSTSASETSPTDPDTDGDCLLDGLELGLTSVVAPAGCIDGTDQSMTYSCNSCCNQNITGLTFQFDSDDSTTTDPLDSDSDNDNYLDGHEDAGLDGLFDEGNLPPAFLTLASSCYEQDCVGASCFGGYDSNPNSVCSPECWNHSECDCDAAADNTNEETENGGNYCDDLWNQICGLPELNNAAVIALVTLGTCDEFTVDGISPSINSILDNNSVNDPGYVNDGDNIPQSCDNCNPGYYLAYDSDSPCPSGSYIGVGNTGDDFQEDLEDGDGIGDSCDDCPNAPGGIKGCTDAEACNYNPFAACLGDVECEYSFPDATNSSDDEIFACSSNSSFNLKDAIFDEYGFGAEPNWGSNQEFTISIDSDDSYSWEDIESLDLTDIGQDWCGAGATVTISLTHTSLDDEYCMYDDAIDCDVCGSLSSLNFQLVVNHEAIGSDAGMDVCFGETSLDTPLPNPFGSFPHCNSMDDYTWTWTLASGDGGVLAPSSLLNPSFTLGGGLLVDDQVVFNIAGEIEGCPTNTHDFTVTISNSSELEFSLEDDISPVTEVNICANASEQQLHFEILSIGGGDWGPDDADLQEWSSTSTPAISAIGGGVYSVEIADIFAEGGSNQVILFLDPDGGCPEDSDTINFVLTEAPSLDFVSSDLVADSILYMCETASDRSFDLEWGGPVSWDIIDSDLNEDLDLTIIEGANSADVQVNSPSASGSYDITTSTMIDQVPYGCSNVSDSFELLITEMPNITSDWDDLHESTYCAPVNLDLASDYFTLDPEGIWNPGEQTIAVEGHDAAYVTPTPSNNVEQITFSSTSDDFMPLQNGIELTINVDDGDEARSCAAVENTIVIHAGASPVIDDLELVSLNSPFNGIEVTEIEIDTEVMCQGSDFTVQAHPNLQDIGTGTTMTSDEIGSWTVQDVVETTGGTLLEVDDAGAGALDVSLTYSWVYSAGNVEFSCASSIHEEIWNIEADTACTGCPIFELPGPAFVACATDLASNSNDEGAYIRWGYFDANGEIGGFFDDGLEQQTIFYPTLDEIEMYGNDLNRLFALVSSYEDLHCGCLSLGENTVFTGVEELILEGIEIFPNPSTGFFQVSIPDELLFVPLKFQVFDSMGRVIVQDLDCSLGTCGLDLTAQADGVYIVRIVDSATNSAYKKFIVKQ